MTLCIYRLKVSIALLLEITAVAALVLMFASNLLYWNNVSRERRIQLEKHVEELEAQLKLEIQNSQQLPP